MKIRPGVKVNVMKSIGRFKKARILTAILIVATVLIWQSGSSAQTGDGTLKVTASFTSENAVAPDTGIEIRLSRALLANERIAITIGQTDVTGIFRQVDSRLVYDAKLLPLPVGTSNLTVYLIAPGGRWKEISRLPLSVSDAAREAKAPSENEKKAGVPVKSEDKKEPEAGQKPETKTDESKPADTNTAEKKSDENKTDEMIAAEPNAGEKKAEETKSEEAKTEAAKPEEAKTEVAKAEETKTEAAKPEEGKTEATGTDAPAEPVKTESSRFFKFLPSFAISMESQPFQSNFPADTRPEKRATFNDFNLTGTIKTEAKMGNITQESNFDFAGASFKEKTLQFGTLGREAPDIDLSSYLMNTQIGKAKFSLGHTGFGNNRHLVNGFSSRGLSINIPINKYFDVTGGILNGTSVVGVSNFLGVSEIRHQVQGGTLGIEFFPKRQNAMRLEVTGFNGYLQALNGVSEGVIVDAERSRGFGLRFITSDKTERFKIEAGYALSRFFNAEDKTLDPDGNAVPLEAVIRSAFYIDSTNQILKDIKLTKTKNLNLSFGFKYEYVEPLYRSLGASPSADKATQDYSLDGSIGEIVFQAGHARANDNLANVPSILKLLTRSNRFSLALPLTALIGKPDKPSPFLPRFGYAIDRTNNFGAAIPVKGGFEVDLATVPDLVNTNQNLSSAWQFKKFNVGYTYSRSFADNRQTGSENKDQLGWVHAVTVGVNPLEILSMNIGFSFDNQENFELDQINHTKTLNLGMTWQPFKGATFTGELSQTLAGDAAKTALTRNVNYSGQFAYTITREKTGFKKFGMQAFARFADAFVRNRNTIEVSNTQTRTKIMTAGMTFNFF